MATEPTSRHDVTPLRFWAGSSLFVAVAWTVGLAFWSRGYPSSESASDFQPLPFHPIGESALFLLLLPAVLVAGSLLVSRRERLRNAGFLIGVLTVAALTFLAFMISFVGTTCLDPGEHCLTSMPLHVTHLVAPLVMVGAGAGVTALCSRRDRTKSAHG